MGRAPNGRSSIYQGADGRWHSYVTVGVKADGSLDRRHVERRTAGEVADAIDQLRERVARGNGVVGKTDTVAEWLTYWNEHVIRPNKAWNTYRDYDVLIRNHYVPSLGEWKLEGQRRRLEPEHVEAMLAKMRRAGLSSAYVHRAFRVLRTALAAAVLRGKAARNVCDMIEKPKVRKKRIEAHNLDEAQALLAAALASDRPLRWALALLLGPRQGEALGIRWVSMDIDGRQPELDISQQLQRQVYAHGCDDPVACVAGAAERRGKPVCRTAPCPPRYEHGCGGTCGRDANLGWRCPSRARQPGCSTHRRACPPLCPPKCAGHARHCPQRTGGLVDVDVKTESGERGIPLPPLIVELAHRHRAWQQEQAELYGWHWSPETYVCADQFGRTPDPRRDHAQWKALLATAGVPPSRLHLARNDAATHLLATGTDISVVQAILGHAHITTTRGYVDVARELKQAAVERIATALVEGGGIEGLLALLPAQRKALPNRSTPE